jgi:chemotaxis protein methyltransferase CheR
VSGGDLLEQVAVEQLVAHTADVTGFAPDAVSRAALSRLLEAERARGRGIQAFLGEVAARAPAAVAALRKAATVGETFFFRQPEHFLWLAERVAQHPRKTPFRVWSAGCATGEEAYSLAACLLASVPAGAGIDVEVLGTDALDTAIAAAEQARYSRSSIRESCPLLYPMVQPIGGGMVTVAPVVREATRFMVHDLRSPPPGEFDVVMCRNVLMYFSPAAFALASEQLPRALAPGGVLVLGPMDVQAGLGDLERIGPPELQIYGRDDARPRRPRPPPVRRKGSTLPPPATVDPAALHEQALVAIERGEARVAERILAELNAACPTYLPGLVERALLHFRQSEQTVAVEWMREVIRRAEYISPADRYPGPDGLPVAFYVLSARAFLRSQGETE